MQSDRPDLQDRTLLCGWEGLGEGDDFGVGAGLLKEEGPIEVGDNLFQKRIEGTFEQEQPKKNRKHVQF